MQLRNDAHMLLPDLIRFTTSSILAYRMRSFLTGLGIGSTLGARFTDRLSRAQAIAAFAACETGVALFALVSKYCFYDWQAREMAGSADGPAGVFALCFAGLVLPTTLMGASLPLLSRAVATSIDTNPCFN